jgi:hypothetical protein
MIPVSPIFKGYEQHEVVFAKTQKEYMPLPALVLEGDERPVVSRWKLDDEEKARIAAGSDILLTQYIFEDLYHPVQMEVSE